MPRTSPLQPRAAAALGVSAWSILAASGCVGVDERAEYLYVRSLHLAPSPVSTELAEVPAVRSWRELTVTALAERWPPE